jgi:RNA polymerase-interacting CarD/CdnL/TRCF family regulator
MSSRSLATARSRRAGENAPPISGGRPVTSIGYAQQIPQQGGAKVRVSQQQQQQPIQQQPTNNGLPFSKLSISDAFGLVTLRLGRVEQWMIDYDKKEDNPNYNTSSNTNSNIDNSVLTSIVHRLEQVELRPTQSMSEDTLNRIVDLVSQHTIEISKHNEQIFKFNRELVETKDILKTFMIKYDLYTSETNNKFIDYESALSDIEKNITLHEPIKEEPIKEELGLTDLTDLKNINIQEPISLVVDDITS